MYLQGSEMSLKKISRANVFIKQSTRKEGNKGGQGSRKKMYYCELGFVFVFVLLFCLVLNLKQKHDQVRCSIFLNEIKHNPTLCLDPGLTRVSELK